MAASLLVLRPRCGARTVGRLVHWTDSCLWPMLNPCGVFESFVADINAANNGGSEAEAQAVFARHGIELL
jgi:hypothetical protein